MVPRRIACLFTEARQSKLREAVRLIRDVIDSDDDFSSDGGMTEKANADKETMAVLRLVAVVIEDELSKHSSPVPHN